jgi:hypothetical protein
VELFESEVKLNILYSVAGSIDPFFFLKTHLNNHIFLYGLTGLQLPDFLTIIPSNGYLYMKLFFSIGLLISDKGLKIISGLICCIGFKDFGYLRFEILTDIHRILDLLKWLTKSLFTFNFIALKKEIEANFDSSFIDIFSFTNIFLVRGKNNLFASDLSRFLKKKVDENIKKYTEFNKKYSLKKKINLTINQ